MADGNGNGNVCERKTPMADYAHTRPRMVLKKESREDDDPQRPHLYYGRSSTEVTANLQPKPPSHAYALQPSPAQTAPQPNHNLKYTEITTLALGLTPIKRLEHASGGEQQQPTSGKFNRITTDITERLRNVVFPASAVPSNDPEPYYGRTKTYVTDPSISDFSSQ